MVGKIGRRVLAGFGVVPIVMAFAAVLTLSESAAPVLSACPVGETKDLNTEVCMPVVPTDVIEMTTADFGGLPEVDGVECTGQNTNECIGLGEQGEGAGPTPTPSAVLTADPTGSGATETSTPTIYTPETLTPEMAPSGE